MASMTFCPSRLCGQAAVPPAKSEAHRAILLAALGEGECTLHGFPPPLCDDVCAMINGVTALGATVRHEGDKLVVTPGAGLKQAQCHVNACAAALRMLIPAFLMRGQAVRFHMDAGLFKRPLDAFEPLINTLGAQMTRDEQALTVDVAGHMPAGSYEIDGSLSSQFASGMLIALSHTEKPSELTVRGPIVSRPYLDMTRKMMERFHIACPETEEGRFTLCATREPSPKEIHVSGDWSQAAVWCCINAMGGEITLGDMHDEYRLQGDARVVDELARLKTPGSIVIDCTDIPDIAPILALTCSKREGTAVLTGVSRLRIKESDRLSATQELLEKLGVQAKVSADGDSLCVHGGAVLRGGFEADARGDHRLVMLLAAAAPFCDRPITVHGVECISKSWPGLIDTYRALGGKCQ